MTCPICGAELCEKGRLEITTGTFISVRCVNPGCNYFDYKTLPANLNGTIIDNYK